MKRDAYSLLEIVIALPLVAILITFLVKGVFGIQTIHHKLDARYEQALERHYFQRRLQQYLSKIDKNKLKKQNFYDQFLEFDFDNGKSWQANASGTLHAQLFLDSSSSSLILELSQNHQPIRREVILSNVLDAQFHYIFEQKNENMKEACPFMYPTDPKISNPQKWAALQITVQELGLKASKQYFFSLPRTHSPQY